MCTIKLTNRPIPFHSTVVKLYLRPKLTEEPTLYNTIKYAEPIQTNKPIPPLQEAAP